MTWHFDAPPTRAGSYLVVDIWRAMEVGQWLPEIGWCIRGKWVGKDGALCWTETPAMPELPKPEWR